MSSLHHTPATVACQPPGHQQYSPPIGKRSVSNHTGDHRLAARYGASLLTAGHTALPNLAFVYYARLGVTEAELVFISQLCSYWWGADDPYPGEAAIAARMGKSKRTVQAYARSLERKGLLHISTQFSPHGRQETNSYNVRPFFRAVEGLARLDGRLIEEQPADSWHGHHSTKTRYVEPNVYSKGRGEPEPLCAVEPARDEETGMGGAQNSAPQENPIEKDHFDLVSMPPTPITTQPDNEPAITQGPPPVGQRNGRVPRPPMVTAPPTFSDPAGPCLCPASVPPRPRGPVAAPLTPDEQVIAEKITALGAELGDDAPASSVTRTVNLWHSVGGSLDRFLRRVDDAAARTRARQGSIIKRRRDDTQAVNGTPYLLAVLTDLLHPAPPPPANASHAAERRRVNSAALRPRHERDRGAHTHSYAVWSDSSAGRSITESNPVWRAVLGELAQILTVDNFSTWLASTRVVRQEGELLSVAVPKPFNKEWLEAKLHGRVMTVLERLGYGSWQIEYVVDATACADHAGATRVS